MGRVDGYTSQSNKKEIPFMWTDVLEINTNSSSGLRTSLNKGETSDSPGQQEGVGSVELQLSECKYREYIYGEEAIRISPTEPYCLRRPIRKEIKEILFIVLRDLRFSSAVVHQHEGLVAVFGNGLSTACIVNMGAQVTSVICIEDGVALHTTQITIRYGGELIGGPRNVLFQDISRCLLWTQGHYQTWPPIRTDALVKPVDLLMLNRLKKSYCQIREGELEVVAVVHSYEDGIPARSHKTRLTALNVCDENIYIFLQCCFGY